MGSTYSLSVNRLPLIPQEQGMSWSLHDAALHNIPEFKVQLAGYVEHTIDKCQAIFANLNRPNFANGLCYSSRLFGANTGFVLTVFAIPVSAINEIVVFDWEKRFEDVAVPGQPVNWQNDLGVRLWP